MNRWFWMVAVALIATASTARAHEHGGGARMAEAAQTLLRSLSDEQRAAVQFSLDAAERGSWSNLPVLAVPPSGVLMKDMDDAQRRAVHELLRASMSSQGYAKFTGVMQLDDVLHEMAQASLAATPVAERRPGSEVFLAARDATNYAVAIFGEPGAATWGWRLAGHHAAANYTVSEGRVAFTPTFLGSSPRVIETGSYAGAMALPHEGDRGLRLMEALTPAQRERARVAEELPDGIFAGPGRKDSLTEFEGLPASALDAAQRRLLEVLVEEYVRNVDFEAADQQMQAIEEAGWNTVWFSWRGPVDPAGRFYYRVHGPRVLIEYNRVDRNHDHSIVRDPANDYGADWLGRHLEEHHPTGEEIREGMRQRIEAAQGD